MADASGRNYLKRELKLLVLFSRSIGYKRINRLKAGHGKILCSHKIVYLRFLSAQMNIIIGWMIAFPSLSYTKKPRTISFDRYDMAPVPF